MITSVEFVQLVSRSPNKLIELFASVCGGVLEVIKEERKVRRG